MASKADEVYLWIRDRIMSGDALPRSPLNADELARQSGISKIPIREALRRLTSEGLVSYRHNTGAIVAPLSWHELAGIRVARGALEPTAARLAATTRTEDQLATLQDQLQQLTDRVALGQLNDFLELNRQFHLALAECSGLPTLSELIDSTLLKVNRYRAVLPISAELAASTLTEHGEIVLAIREQDADAAESAVRAHVTGEHTISGEAHRIRGELFDDEPLEATAATSVGDPLESQG